MYVKVSEKFNNREQDLGRQITEYTDFLFEIPLKAEMY